MATTTPTEQAGGAAELEANEEVLETVATDVETILQRREALSDVLGDLERARFRGEAVQTDLDAVLAESESLRHLARFEIADRLDDVLEATVETGRLDAETCETFDEWWSGVSWVAPGIKAYDRERDSVYTHWTGRDMEFSSVDGKLVVEHTLQYGVDRLYRVRAPIDELFDEAAARLNMLTQVLAVAVRKGHVDADAVERIFEKRETLESVAAALDDADELIELVDDVPRSADEDGDEGRARNDSDVEDARNANIGFH